MGALPCVTSLQHAFGAPVAHLMPALPSTPQRMPPEIGRNMRRIRRKTQTGLCVAGLVGKIQSHKLGDQPVKRINGKLVLVTILKSVFFLKKLIITHHVKLIAGDCRNTCVRAGSGPDAGHRSNI